jgi:hypothetical protein
MTAIAYYTTHHCRKPVVLQGKDPVTPFEKRLARPVTDETDANTNHNDDTAVMDLKGSSSSSSSSDEGEIKTLHHSTATSTHAHNSGRHHDSNASSDEGEYGIHYSDSTAQVRHRTNLYCVHTQTTLTCRLWSATPTCRQWNT